MFQHGAKVALANPKEVFTHFGVEKEAEKKEKLRKILIGQPCKLSLCKSAWAVVGGQSKFRICSSSAFF